jgi:hypothetical protein
MAESALPTVPSEPAYFPVSLIKLAVMSVCTFGLYEIYWFYRNWALVKQRERSHVNPVAYAILAYFSCYPLFRRIRATAAERKLQMPAHPGILAVSWVVTTLTWKLPDPYGLASFAAVGFLLPVQLTVNRINSAVAPSHNVNEHFSRWNVAALVIGIPLLAASVAVVFWPIP